MSGRLTITVPEELQDEVEKYLAEQGAVEVQPPSSFEVLGPAEIKMIFDLVQGGAVAAGAIATAGTAWLVFFQKFKETFKGKDVKVGLPGEKPKALADLTETDVKRLESGQ